ncbi:hypothetical protein [Actinomyces oricola]|uniref:hypothetical protein n=1 Tax=Actinomyces oricola TaxID=206043 RepID=UPI000FFE39DC|nr:hypothetical protein [Actinomyces oricola]
MSGLLGLCRLVEMLERTWRRRRVKARTSADLWAVTTTGGTWRLAGCRDYWSKYEHPSVMIVTGNGGPFRSLNFELFIASGPELGHVRTPVKSPGANGPTERGLGTWEHERLYLDAIDDALDLVARAEDYRTEYNTVHPRETTALNQPLQLRRRA